MTAAMVRQRLLLLSALVAAPVASAQDHRSAVVQGVGGAVLADPNDITNVRFNPAAIALTERYDAQAIFQGNPGGDLRWGGTLVDSQLQEFLTFGLSYDGAISRPDFLPEELPPFVPVGTEAVNLKKTHEVTLAAAVPVFDRKLSFGVNGTLSFFNNTWNGKGVTGNLDVGVAAMPIEGLSFGFSARDVLPIKEQFDRPTTLGFGVRGGKEDLFIAAGDVEYVVEGSPKLPLNAHLGIQGAVRALRLRTGWDLAGQTGIHRVGFGFGFASEAGSIDYAIQIPVNQPNLVFGDIAHTLSITVRTNAFRDQAKNEDETPSKARWD